MDIQTTTPSAGVGAAVSHGGQVADNTLACGEYLAFSLCGQDCAADILCVQAVRNFERPTRMLGAASHALGVLDLRGFIVPVLDLRARTGLPSAPNHHKVTVPLTLSRGTVSVVVDSVSDMVALSAQNIQSMSAMIDGAGSGVFTGLAISSQIEAQRALLLVNFEAPLPAGKCWSNRSLV